MFNVHDLLHRHYSENIRLGTERRALLARHRDATLERLRSGLVNLEVDRGRRYPPFLRTFDQGGYAMHTLNQRAEGEFDIDTAVVFAHDALPTTALAARQLVTAALIAGGGNFTKEPEARTNAVTTWYAEGHHVDLAIYREHVTPSGSVLEHAGADWVVANPQAITEWFTGVARTLSPAQAQGATVGSDQFRRITRYIKAFTKSRPSWSLPGGLIISTLVAECYKPDPHRDDIALYRTLVSLRDRTDGNCEVKCPVDSSRLTSKDEYRNQVRRLNEKLRETIPRLDILLRGDCQIEGACSAWNHVFRHSFWNREQTDEAVLLSGADTRVRQLRLDVGVARANRDRIRWLYRTTGPRVPKGIWLRFTIDTPPIDQPFDTHWIVKNFGDEAIAHGDLGHETTTATATEQWERTAYKGDHKMICELRRNGQVVARGERTIRIGGA